MPAYNYYPSPYQPYPYYQAPYQTTVQQPMSTQPAQAVQPSQPTYSVPSQSSIIWISGEREAQMYPVAPNNAVTLWSQTEPVVYLKQADATGKPTLKVYDLVERPETVSAAPGTAGDNTASYATKEDLQAIVGAVKGIDDAVGLIRSDIDTIKGDMYGIAGKKKSTAKKTVEVEDDE